MRQTRLVVDVSMIEVISLPSICIYFVSQYFQLDFEVDISAAREDSRAREMRFLGLPTVAVPFPDPIRCHSCRAAKVVSCE